MSTESSRVDFVRSFVAAWNRCDVDFVIDCFGAEAVYHNVPMPPIVGKTQIAESLRLLMSKMSDVDWRIVQIAMSANGVVLTERLDVFKIEGHAISIPVMGAFEFLDGLISRWSDYFDLAQYRAQLGLSSP